MSIARNAFRPARSFFLAALGATLGCDSAPPSKSIQFANGMLQMSISEDWVLQRDAGKQAFYKHGLMSNAKLTFENQTFDFGTPMTLQAVRSVIGTELNRRYGGVNARLGYGGCAVLSYEHKEKEGGRSVYTQNWVVAHPLGYGAVSRVAITLTVPDGQQATQEFQLIVDTLDKQVGDAEMPEA